MKQKQQGIISERKRRDREQRKKQGAEWRIRQQQKPTENSRKQKETGGIAVCHGGRGSHGGYRVKGDVS